MEKVKCTWITLDPTTNPHQDPMKLKVHPEKETSTFQEPALGSGHGMNICDTSSLSKVIRRPCGLERKDAVISFSVRWLGLLAPAMPCSAVVIIRNWNRNIKSPKK